MRVVVVGAGPAGLFSLRALQKSFGDCTDTNADSDAENAPVQYVCYERRSTVGGEWVYSGDGDQQAESYDKAGNPMMTSVYKHLQMNTPSLLWQPHPEHAFPVGTPLYPKRDHMCDYLLSFAAKFQLEKYVRFGKMVSDISFDKTSGRFWYKLSDLATGEESHEQCDYLLMCVGQFCVPRIPDTVSFSEFSGDTLHYHWLRDPSRLNGKRILVVGSSWAAMDMVILLNRPGGAAKMHVSWNQSVPLWTKSVLHQVSIHPKIRKAARNTVTFEDGSQVDVDVVLFCSGFKQVHPLSDDLQLDFNQSRFLFPLYKHVVHPKCPRLFFLGKANTIGMYMMRPQAEFACQVMRGCVKLPTESEMLEDISKFQAYWGAQLKQITQFDLTKYSPIGELEYAQAMAVVEMAGLQPMTPADCFKHIYYQSAIGRFGDVMNFKDYVVEYREDPDKPGSQLPYLVPPK